MNTIRIDGVFDLEIARHLSQLGIKHIGVDCYPLSLNFIQGHVLEKILSEMRFDSITFQFYDEKINMIQTISFELNKKFADLHENLFIETLYNQKKFSEYDLKQSITWDYQTELLHLAQVKSLHLNQSKLIVNKIELSQLLQLKQQYPKLEILMGLDWEEKILVEFNQKLQTKIFCFNLGNGLMSGYRSVDYHILDQVVAKRILDIKKDFST
jgi:hypothetical protein